MQFKKMLAILLACAMVFSMTLTVSATDATDSTGSTDSSDSAVSSEEVVILHTNDTHCDIENGFGFAGVAAYLEDMEAVYGEDNVTLVDAGDAVQGGAVGKLTNGEAIIELMNAVGYDIMTLGNHEFDYQVEQMLYLMEMFTGITVSSNFIDLLTGESVYDPYTIVDYGSFQVAYVGITTPETYTKATPAYFQDDDGNFIYGFCEGDDGENLYQNVQESVDAAIAEGADYVIAVAHLGIDEASSPYTSTEVIANTTGIDVLLDGHSHTEVEGVEIANKDGDMVITNQTGEKFDNLGKITIDNSTGTITAELISSDDYTEKDATIQALVDGINEEQGVLLEQVVTTIDTTLIAYDLETDEEIIRSQETNLGDFCADAYRYVLDTDIALVNGGGIRSNIEAGEVTYADIIAVHPWGNYAMSVEVSGQAILDALEMGASSCPSSSGGFLQVSGLTYTINTSIESSIVTDEYGSFVSVDGEYRVSNVMVGDEALDLEKMYSVASHNYLLENGGDGMTMFQDATVIASMFAIDNEVLMTYMTDYDIDGKYDDVDGDGRITIIDGSEDTSTDTETEEETEEEGTDNPETGDVSSSLAFSIVFISVALVAVITKKKLAK